MCRNKLYSVAAVLAIGCAGDVREQGHIAQFNDAAAAFEDAAEPEKKLGILLRDMAPMAGDSLKDPLRMAEVRVRFNKLRAYLPEDRQKEGLANVLYYSYIAEKESGRKDQAGLFQERLLECCDDTFWAMMLDPALRYSDHESKLEDAAAEEKAETLESMAFIAGVYLRDTARMEKIEAESKELDGKIPGYRWHRRKIARYSEMAAADPDPTITQKLRQLLPQKNKTPQK